MGLRERYSEKEAKPCKRENDTHAHTVGVRTQQTQEIRGRDRQADRRTRTHARAHAREYTGRKGGIEGQIEADGGSCGWAARNIM